MPCVRTGVEWKVWGDRWPVRYLHGKTCFIQLWPPPEYTYIHTYIHSSHTGCSWLLERLELHTSQGHPGLLTRLWPLIPYSFTDSMLWPWLRWKYMVCVYFRTCWWWGHLLPPCMKPHFSKVSWSPSDEVMGEALTRPLWIWLCKRLGMTHPFSPALVLREWRHFS